MHLRQVLSESLESVVVGTCGSDTATLARRVEAPQDPCLRDTELVAFGVERDDCRRRATTDPLLPGTRGSGLTSTDNDLARHLAVRLLAHHPRSGRHELGHLGTDQPLAPGNIPRPLTPPPGARCAVRSSPISPLPRAVIRSRALCPQGRCSTHRPDPHTPVPQRSQRHVPRSPPIGQDRRHHRPESSE